MKANAVTSGKRERMPQTNYCTVTEGACCSSNPPSSSHSLQTRRIYTAAHPQSEHVHHNHTCSFFLFLFLLLYFFAQTCFPFVQTQKQAYTLLVFFISLLQSGWIHGVHAQPLPHHASLSLGVRGTGNGARECGGSTGLLEEGGVVVAKGVGGWHTSAGRERERDGLKGSGRMRRGLQGSVASGTHRVGVRVKWGGTSAIEGPGIVFFPWSTTPFFPPSLPLKSPTQTPKNRRPPPRSPFPPELSLSASLSFSMPCQERSGAGSVSLHRAGVFSMNLYRWRSSTQWMDYLSQNRVTPATPLLVPPHPWPTTSLPAVPL